jgi:peptidoglycan hydrolase-like protein with peptidoglycan-binding domain
MRCFISAFSILVLIGLLFGFSNRIDRQFLVASYLQSDHSPKPQSHTTKISITDSFGLQEKTLKPGSVDHAFLRTRLNNTSQEYARDPFRGHGINTRALPARSLEESDTFISPQTSLKDLCVQWQDLEALVPGMFSEESIDADRGLVGARNNIYYGFYGTSDIVFESIAETSHPYIPDVSGAEISLSCSLKVYPDAEIAEHAIRLTTILDYYSVPSSEYCLNNQCLLQAMDTPITYLETPPSNLLNDIILIRYAKMSTGSNISLMTRYDNIVLRLNIDPWTTTFSPEDSVTLLVRLAERIIGRVAESNEIKEAVVSIPELPCTLSLEMNGCLMEILAVQLRLQQLGYTQIGAADGIFGPMTEQAVLDFQTDNELAADGIVGPITWEYLFRSTATTIPVALPAGFQEWLIQKDALISYLEEPPFPLFSFEIPLSDLPLIDDWGYDEHEADNLLQRLEADYESYNAGLLTEAEQTILTGEADAFGRLVLTEQALRNIYPLYTETSYNTAESMTNVAAITIGAIQAINQAVEKVIQDNNPFSEVRIRLLRAAERRLLDLGNHFIQFVVRTIDNIELRQDLLLGWGQVYTGIQLKFDEDLDTGQALLDIFLDEGLKSTFAASFLEDYFTRTQPLINEGVSLVEQSRNTPMITGKFEQADLHVAELQIDAESYSVFINEQHNDFQQAIDISEAVSALGYLSSGFTGPAGPAVGALSSILSILTNGYDGVCQAKHLQYLHQNASLSAHYAFYADQPVNTTFPTHCDFDRSTYIPWQSEQLTSAESLIPVENPIQLTTLDQAISPDQLIHYRELLAEIRDFVEVGDNSGLALAIDSLFTAEKEFSVELTIIASSTLGSQIPFQIAQPIQGVITDYDGQISALYLTLFSYFDAPEDPKIRETVLNQINQIEETLTILDTIPTPDTAKNGGSTDSVSNLIIADIDIPQLLAENKTSELNVTLVNTSNTIAPFILSISNSDTSLDIRQEGVISPDKRQSIEITLPSLAPGNYLLLLNLTNEDGLLRDSQPVMINVMEREDLEAITNSSLTDDEQVIDGIDEGELEQHENQEVIPETNNRCFIVIGLAAILVLISLGLYVVFRTRKSSV